MKFLLLLLVAVFAHDHSHGDHDHDHGDDGHVLTLDSGNFDDTIAKSDLILVEFYAPWCGHCKRLAPEYAQASIELYNNKKVALAKVDCTTEKAVCDRYEVKGFPTLKVFRAGGSVSEYEGGRTAKEIVSYLKKQSLPSVTQLASEDDVKKFAQENEIVVIGFGLSDTQVFEAAANADRDEAAFGTASGSAAAQYGAKSGDIVLLRKFDEPVVIYSDEQTVTAISNWVKGNTIPLVGEIGPENYQKYVKLDVPMLWLFIDIAEKDATIALAKTAAQQQKGKLSFVYLDGKRWVEHGKSFGLSGDLPGVVIEDRKARKNYLFNEGDDLTSSALASFAADFVNGNLKAHLKSEPIPENNNGPVTTLVGKNFESIVFDANKDVFVEFYAPWCGHCKKLVPEYEKLGELFADNANIVIAMIDATANDSPAEIRGFPTLMLYTSKDKQNPVTFNGERNAEGMAAFIKEHATSAPAAPAAAGVHTEL